jgi:hypothetical protein
MSERPNLFASVLIDPPGGRDVRQLGKVQVSSLLRSLFHGDLVIWRNFPEPLYPVERKGVHELEFFPEHPVGQEEEVGIAIKEARIELARSLVPHAPRYGWIILANAGVMALRNWDHLFEQSEAEVMVSRMAKGEIDDSLVAIKGEAFEKIVARWEAGAVSGLSEGGLAGALVGGEFSVGEFERGEVVRAFDDGVSFRDVIEAAMVVLEGGKAEEKTKAAFALHMMKTFGDRDGLFLDLLES